jgi:hypothetical protein
MQYTMPASAEKVPTSFKNMQRTAACFILDSKRSFSLNSNLKVSILESVSSVSFRMLSENTFSTSWALAAVSIYSQVSSSFPFKPRRIRGTTRVIEQD